jgi:hypothetical protein
VVSLEFSELPLRALRAVEGDHLLARAEVASERRGILVEAMRLPAALAF